MELNKKKAIITTLKIVGYSLNILLALLTLCSGYGGVVNPETSTLPAILAMTFPIWLCCSVVVLIVDFFIDKKYAIIQGVALVLCIGPILSFCPMNISRNKLSPEEQKRSFTVMSYNVYGLNSIENPPKHGTYDTHGLVQQVKQCISNPTLSWILKQDIDVVCIQEFNFQVSDDSINSSKPKLLTRELYDSVCVAYPYRTTNGRGAIFSKFPLYPLNLPQYQGDGTEFHVAAVVEILGHRTLVMAAHLQSIGLDPSDKELYREITEGEGGKKALKEAKGQLLGKLSKAFRERARQAEMIRHQIDSLGIENVIICGDFNDIQDSYAMRVMAGDDFKSAFTNAAFGPVITYHANRFYFHIDHILYRGELQAQQFKKYDFGRSDHYPISARFLWQENARKVDRTHKGIDLIDRDR